MTLVLYAFATDVRSSRAIERHCRQDVAYRVITGNAVPDHATIARFIVRHQGALADLFSEVLRLCDQGGLVKSGVVAIDGTRLSGNASRASNHEFGKIAKEIVERVKATKRGSDFRKWGHTLFLLPEFENVRKCAWFNYQREKIVTRRTRRKATSGSSRRKKARQPRPTRRMSPRRS